VENGLPPNSRNGLVNGIQFRKAEIIEHFQRTFEKIFKESKYAQTLMFHEYFAATFLLKIIVRLRKLQDHQGKHDQGQKDQNRFHHEIHASRLSICQCAGRYVLVFLPPTSLNHG
jgi:hypothetical protein